jgi:HAD superfamily hydrolase (TIGR01549 family)
VADSPIARLFDELFYGAKLFQKQNGIEPEYVKDNGARRPAPKPMIENDRTVITEKTLKELTSLVGGNLAMVTGRSRLAAEHSLGRLINYFDIDACAFLEDEPREYSKPNPYGALRAMKRMKAKRAVYAGDSQEDLLMARRAEMQSGFLISFVGIYGLSPQPKTTAVKFRNGGVLTARSVNSLPSIIRKLKVL